jgi:hypothetical protein
LKTHTISSQIAPSNVSKYFFQVLCAHLTLPKVSINITPDAPSIASSKATSLEPTITFYTCLQARSSCSIWFDLKYFKNFCQNPADATLANTFSLTVKEPQFPDPGFDADSSDDQEGNAEEIISGVDSQADADDRIMMFKGTTATIATAAQIQVRTCI